jgi:integrase
MSGWREGRHMRKKRGNGLGSIFQRGKTGKWYVKITVGYSEKGYPIQKSLGTFLTYEEATDAVNDYKTAPFAWNSRELKLSEVWEIFTEKRLPNVARSSRSSFSVAYKHCQSLHNLRYLDIVQLHIQDILDAHNRHYSVQIKIRNLFNHLNSLAFELGLDIRKIRPELLKLCKYEAKITKTIFTEQEILLVKNLAKENYWAKIILTFLYTGMRFTELLELKITDYNAENRTIKCGIKTDAGRGRIVPVHSFLQKFIEKQATENNNFLFEFDGKPLSETRLRVEWNSVMQTLKMKHTPHECRHTFETRMRLAGADDLILDKIIGHKSGHVGRDVYSHFTPDMLHNEIEKLK